MTAMGRLQTLTLLGAALLTACGGGGNPPKSALPAGVSAPVRLTALASASAIPADGTASATITVLATSPDNERLAGVPVRFTASSGGIESLTPTTDSRGEASARLSAGSNPAARIITVTAVAGDVVASVPVEVSTGAAKPASPAALFAVSSEASLPADGSATATITVVATDAASRRLAQVPVEFSADDGLLTVTQNTTTATGGASATLSTAGNPTPRTVTVKVTAAGLTRVVRIPVVNSFPMVRQNG